MIITVTLNPVLDRTYQVSRLVFDDVVRSTPARLDWVVRASMYHAPYNP